MSAEAASKHALVRSELSAEDIRAAVASRSPQRVRVRGYRRSAVLAPLVKLENGWRFLLTRRADDLEHHRGQVAFPGGAVDGDETAAEAALRELNEETGLPPRSVEILGEVDEIWTPTGYIITPVVGILDTLDGLAPNPGEVARAFTVPVDFFAREKNAELKTMRVGAWVRDVYFYHYDNETIWGATAFIVRGIVKRLIPYLRHCNSNNASL